MIQIKGLFAHQSAFVQLLVLVFLALIGALVASFISLLFLVGAEGGVDLFQSPHKLRFVQFISALGTFLFPAWGMSVLCGTNVRAYLSIGKMPTVKVLVLLFLGYLLFSPLMALSQCLNQLMTLPEFMAPLEEWMIEQEESAERLTLVLLSENDGLSVILNLVVIALTAGITEEFFFRGALQRVFERWHLNPHAVIWVTAILFSAFHLQFYGFIPRMFLGAYFGYLLYWSRNIWVPVAAHTINNATAVLLMSNGDLKDMEYINGDMGSEFILPLTIATVVSLFFLIPLLRKVRKELVDVTSSAEVDL